jgi:MoaA/NifB/PqqE/SkfB family radical SAM enzyme
MNNFNKLYSSYIEEQKKAVFNIETTSRCRLQCPFCQRQRKGGKEKVKLAGEMSYEDMRKIYNFTTRMNFCGQISDPIYHTDFLKILEIKKNEYPNNIMSIRTNGSGKKLSWWEAAYNLCDKTTIWTFGLDGASQKTANIYRIGTNFNEIFKAMIIGTKNKMVTCGTKVTKQNNLKQNPGWS